MQSSGKKIKNITAPSWWDGAVIYQIYPRSFYDSNSDGIGDLGGILAKIDYLKSLHIDAIWISPFYQSPMHDFGYDVSDYCKVDKIFGNINDFKKLIKKAHENDIKIIIDLVLSHSSIEHEWFKESRKDRTNPKADYYVWSDPKNDGTPPNNWLSIFGGSAWTFEPRRGQYYLHNFLKEQPDLNYHNKEVQNMMIEQSNFWLDIGVDGFRLDAFNFCFHDKYLRDNPEKPAHLRLGQGYTVNNPYAFQYHIYDNTRPEMLDFITKFRKNLNNYGHIATMAELQSEDTIATLAEYSDPKKGLSMGYSFAFFKEDLSAEYFYDVLHESNERIIKKGLGKPCWSFSNHDVIRAISRVNIDLPKKEKAKFLFSLLLSLPGTICIYQGEELGLLEADVKFEDLQDPYGITFWPEFKGRDGCRVPIPWEENAANFGFSTGEPWLKMPKIYGKYSVDRHENDKNSILNLTRKFLEYRKKRKSLLQGDFYIDAIIKKDILVLKRISDDEKLMIVTNFSNKEENISFIKEDIKLDIDNPFVTKEMRNKFNQQKLIGAYSCNYFLF